MLQPRKQQKREMEEKLCLVQWLLHEVVGTVQHRTLQTPAIHRPSNTLKLTSPKNHYSIP